MTKGRVAWIDMARGCAIALVVLAHTPIPTKLLSYIYSFHVPLFFMVSGYLLHDRLDTTWTKFFKKKFVSLVIPYFFFSFITYVYWIITRKMGLNSDALAIDPASPLNGTFMAIRDSIYMTHNGALWFLCSLFLSEITFYAIFRLVRGDRMLLAVCILISAIIGMLYNTFIDIILPWSIDTVPIVVVFIGLGFFLKEYSPKWIGIKRTWKSKLLVLGSLVLTSILTWHFNKTGLGRVDIFYSQYGNFFLYFLSALVGSLAVMLVFESFITRSKFFSYLGKNSIIIYALHQKVIFGIIGIIFVVIFGKALPFSQVTTFDKLENGAIYLFLTLITLIPVAWLLNKYTPQLIGRGSSETKKQSTRF